MTNITDPPTEAAPPAYGDHVASPGASVTHGFPNGYFIIRHLSTNRVLDLGGSATADNSEVFLWPEKEGSLVEELRDPGAHNQVFFIDHTGALCSRVSGHAIDVQDGALVLRHRRPYAPPFPNKYSHPLPTFSYDARTNIICATFACDPNYPNPLYPLTAESSSAAWRSRDYVLASVPMKAPPSILDSAHSFLLNAASQLQLLPGRQGEQFDIAEDEVLDADRADDEDVNDDNSGERWRHAKLVSLPLGWNDKTGKGGGGKRDRERRRWMVVPLVRRGGTPRNSHS
ncbi:hypothetical protein DACRYDRAFT_62552 [Dacryopinax primogenitus]|uniref:Ricin B lectin domain-containing protein n=1 Tax=Dacryopinax primogenitus (strain DJM 731) TaxID=1858805 RepID=M5G6H2_DACPD|nr:uncharacterized protein DACRYDRAFT_62552 [Dacryopinax primogenitus]EJU05856.1 hypothetical protein DACRYDRAFT_62552 [Dacryopinax primogenitus]